MDATMAYSAVSFPRKARTMAPMSAVIVTQNFRLPVFTEPPAPRCRLTDDRACRGQARPEPSVALLHCRLVVSATLAAALAVGHGEGAASSEGDDVLGDGRGRLSTAAADGISGENEQAPALVTAIVTARGRRSAPPLPFTAVLLAVPVAHQRRAAWCGAGMKRSLGQRERPRAQG